MRASVRGCVHSILISECANAKNNIDLRVFKSNEKSPNSLLTLYENQKIFKFLANSWIKPKQNSRKKLRDKFAHTIFVFPLCVFRKEIVIRLRCFERFQRFDVSKSLRSAQWNTLRTQNTKTCIRHAFV